MNRHYKSPKILKSIKRMITRKNLSEHNLIFDFFLRLPHKNPQDRILIDVGAHYGISMLKFARSGWTVYCFEPDDNNRYILEKTILENKLKKVIVDNRAVSDVEKRVKYYTSEISDGISSMIRFHESHKEAKEVETITLSSFCKVNDICNIDFLKIDTEGNDLRVIEGLDLTHNRPTVILCEYEDAKTRLIGYTKEEMIKYLEENGYRWIISEWYPIVEYGIRHQWKKLTDDILLVDNKSWGNIIATQPEYYQHLIDATKRKLKYKRNCIKLVNQ